MWSRGYLLDTERVRSMTREERDNAEAGERMTIFSNYTALDFGQSRRVVCHLNPLHMDFERNVKLIEAAPELLKWFELMYKNDLRDLDLEERVQLDAFINRLKKAQLFE